MNDAATLDRLGENFNKADDRTPLINDSKNPDFHDQDYLLQVLGAKVFDHDTMGLTVVGQFRIVESTNPKLINREVGYMVTDLLGTNKKLKARNLRNMLAAIYQRDENAAHDWIKVAKLTVQGAGNDRQVRCKVDLPKRAKTGNMFCAATFRAA
jgi:acetone carboxylase gamma subunit